MSGKDTNAQKYSKINFLTDFEAMQTQAQGEDEEEEYRALRAELYSRLSENSDRFGEVVGESKRLKA